MTAKKNPEISRSEALALAWKSRHNYNGYDRTPGSQFNSWRSIIRTAKGRAVGFPDSWKSFDSFLGDVAGDWAHGMIVRRHDTSKPHGSGNSFWAEKGTENCGRLATLYYGGETKTLLEWSAEFSLSYSGVRQRYFKGKSYTAEEILFGKQRKQRSEKERSRDFRISRMLGAYKLRDKKRGQASDIDIDFMRAEIEKGCVYCGDMSGVGLDRIDNSMGHTKNNVVPCCYTCNCARMDNFSHEEMFVLGAAIRGIKGARHAEAK